MGCSCSLGKEGVSCVGSLGSCEFGSGLAKGFLEQQELVRQKLLLLDLKASIATPRNVTVNCP